MQSAYRSHVQSGIQAKRSETTAIGAGDFLRAHDQIAALLPTLTRIIALQKDCAMILPGMFVHCDVMQLDGGQLILATPNASLATKLKQNLPKLQDELLRLGWQVSAIRLKVQVAKSLVKSRPSKSLELPALAVTAFAELSRTLVATPSNQALKAALDAMVLRHR